MTEKPKLYYYKAEGRANQLRLAMVAGGMEWEDVYAESFTPSAEDRATWQELGGNCTTNIPMLVMPDHKAYTQSSAVLRAIGRMTGLMPTSDEDLYLLDNAIAAAEDLRKCAYKAIVMFGATPADVEEYTSKVLPNHLQNFTYLLGDGDYLAGSKLTVADITCYDAMIHFGENMIPGALGAFPKLQAWKARVHAKINHYYETPEYKDLFHQSPASLEK